MVALPGAMRWQKHHAEIDQRAARRRTWGEVRRGELTFSATAIAASRRCSASSSASPMRPGMTYPSIDADENLAAASAVRSRHDMARTGNGHIAIFPEPSINCCTVAAGDPSGGEQQTLAIGRGPSMTNRNLLMLDWSPAFGWRTFLVGEDLPYSSAASTGRKESSILLARTERRRSARRWRPMATDRERLDRQDDTAEALKRIRTSGNSTSGAPKGKNFGTTSTYSRRKRWLTWSWQPVIDREADQTRLEKVQINQKGRIPKRSCSSITAGLASTALAIRRRPPPTPALRARYDEQGLHLRHAAGGTGRPATMRTSLATEGWHRGPPGRDDRAGPRQLAAARHRMLRS